MRVIEKSGVTSEVYTDYINVNMNLDMRADVEISKSEGKARGISCSGK